jgi:hypothetical protein
MRKKILKHKWNPSPVIRQGELSRKVCEKCKCEKYFDLEFGQTVYMDRFGKIVFRAPDCVLPYTKI